MKTFRQLREDWIESINLKYANTDKELPIYKNPSKKEMLEALRSGFGGFRGFITPKGNLYVWGSAIHAEVHFKAKVKELHSQKLIPITAEFTGNKIDVRISTFINDMNFGMTSIFTHAEIVKENKTLKRSFSNIKVRTDRYYS